VTGGGNVGEGRGIVGREGKARGGEGKEGKGQGSGMLGPQAGRCQGPRTGKDGPVLCTQYTCPTQHCYFE